jgi:O-antigen/teichoic acid export membrane protein
MGRNTPRFRETLPRYVLASAFTSGARLATLAVAFRVLTPNGFAQLDLFLYLSIASSALAICGQDSAALRFLSRLSGPRNTKHVSAAAGLVALAGQAVLAAALFTLQPILAPLVPSISPATLVTCAIVHSIGWSLTGVYGSALRAADKADLYLLASVVHFLLRAAALGLLLAPGCVDPNASSLAVTIAGSQFLSGIAFAVCAREHWSFNTPPKPVVAEMVRYGLPLCGVVALSSIGPVVDRTVIGTIGGQEWLTDYAVAAVPVTVLLAFVQILNLAWVPAALNAQADGNPSFSRVSSQVGLSFAILVFSILCLGAKPLMLALHAPRPETSAALLPIVGLLFVLRLLSSFTAIGLVFEKRTAAKLLVSLFTVSLSLSLGILSGLIIGPPAIPLGAFLGQFTGWIVETAYSNHVCPSVRQPLLLMASAVAGLAVIAIGGWLISYRTGLGAGP